MEQFTAIDIEVLINGTWTSLWADVLHAKGIQGSRGILSNEIEDRVADPGTLQFSLDNSATNSAGLIGRYSPGHANCLSGWNVGLPVRLKFSYDTWTRYKWFGYIETDGIRVLPGTQSDRRVDVTCVDFMGLAAQHKMNLMTYRANMFLNTAIKEVLANMPVTPQAISLDAGDPDNASTGALPFPLLFDLASPETSAIAEFHKIATGAAPLTGSPGFGFVTLWGDGQNGETLAASYRFPTKYLPTPTALASKLLRRDGTSDRILLQSGDFLLREGGSLEVNLNPPTGDEVPNFDDDDIGPDSQFSYGKDIANYVTIISYPRRVDADATTTVLWSLENPTLIAAGQTVTLRGPYNDPDSGQPINAIDFTTPVANTDYKANAAANGSGSDLTSSLSVIAKFGAAEVELSLTNTGGSPLYTGGTATQTIFQVRGKGVYIEDTARQITTDATSMQRYGVKPLTIDSKYIDLTKVFGSSVPYGQETVSAWKDPAVSVDRLSLIANRDVKNMVHFLFLESRDRINITESMNALSAAPYSIQGYEFEIIDGQYVYWQIICKAF